MCGAVRIPILLSVSVFRLCFFLIAVPPPHLRVSFTLRGLKVCCLHDSPVFCRWSRETSRAHSPLVPTPRWRRVGGRRELKGHAQRWSALNAPPLNDDWPSLSRLTFTVRVFSLLFFLCPLFTLPRRGHFRLQIRWCGKVEATMATVTLLLARPSALTVISTSVPTEDPAAALLARTTPRTRPW